MRLDGFELARLEGERVTAIGNALAEGAFERGDRLLNDERGALTHWSMWGSDGYPVRKLGRRGWIVDHPAARGTGVYKRRREAVAAWEILVAKWVRMDALERMRSL